MSTTEISPVTVSVSEPCQHQFQFSPRVDPLGQGFRASISITCAKCGVRFEGLDDKGKTHDPVTFRFAEAGAHAAIVAEVTAKQTARATKESAKSPDPKPGPDPAKGLPGTEMLLLTSELGVPDKPGCGCKSTAATMDRLGVQGCRERINELTLTVAANWESWGWADKLKAVSVSAWKAAGLGVKATDPIKSLLNLSIDRAEVKAQQLKETAQ